ncbi:MAG: hypothetical protein M3P85_01055, partial [Actinomycetota bacterium]|nr:hypothetical protein [Actinomycetota bacterium]
DSLKVPPEVAPADDFDTVIVAAQEAFHADARTTSPEADRWIEVERDGRLVRRRRQASVARSDGVA